MFLLIWALAAVLVLSEISCAGMFTTSRARWAGLGVFALLPMGLVFVFGLGLALQLNLLSGIVNPTPQAADAVVHSDQLAGVTSYYTISLILLMLGAALVFMKENQGTPAAWTSNRLAWVALVPVIVIIALWTNTVILPPLRADVAHKLGQDYSANQQWDMSIALYRHAIRLAPQEDFYYMALGRAFQEKSNIASSDPVSQFNDQTRLKDVLDLDAQHTARLNRTDLLYAAQAMLTHARNLSPLYASHTVNLARFYLPNLPVDSPSKSRLADLANQYYAEAIRLSPNDATLWNEWAEFDLTYMSDSEAAIRKLKESVRADPQFTQTYLSIGKAYMARQEFEQAAEAYERALAVKPDLAEAQGKLAFLYYRQGRLTEAIQAYLKYIEMAPQASNVWEAHKNLALLYKQTGDLVQAIRESQMAASLASSDITPQLNDLVEQLRAQMNTSQPPALLVSP
jgi:tetratricopeptide (TPR) repeat protein